MRPPSFSGPDVPEESPITSDNKPPHAWKELTFKIKLTEQEYLEYLEEKERRGV